MYTVKWDETHNQSRSVEFITQQNMGEVIAFFGAMFVDYVSVKPEYGTA